MVKFPFIQSLSRLHYIKKLYISFATGFAKSISEFDVQDLSAFDKDLIIFKYANENTNEEAFFARCWPSMIRIICNSSKYKLLVSDQIKVTADKLGKTDLSIEEHCNLLQFLVNTSFETKIIKEIIKQETEKINELTREKMILEVEA